MDIDGGIAGGKNLTGLFHFGIDACLIEPGNEIFWAESSEGGMKERASFSEGGDDAASIGGLGQIAARASGHEDFGPDLAILFEEEDAMPEFGGMRGGEESGGSRSHDDDVPERGFI